MFKSFRAGYYHCLCNQKTDIEDRHKIDRTTIVDLYADVIGLMGTKQNQPMQQTQGGESDPFYDMKPFECFKRLKADVKMGQLRKPSSLKKVKSNNPDAQIEAQSSLPMIRLTHHRSMNQPFTNNQATYSDPRIDRR